MKKTKTMFISSLLLGMCMSPLLAQERTTSSGNDVSGAGGSVSYSIGLIDYISATGSGGAITQGVQQPYEIYSISIENEAGVQLSAVVFPNPTSEYITLSISNDDLSNMSYSLLDAQGKILSQQIVKDQIANIQMGFLSTGIYFLSVYKNNTELKTFKIIKN